MHNDLRKSAPVDPGRLLAEALRQARREAGLTQTAMARALGISQPTLNRLENASQNATLRTLKQLGRAFKCEPGDLFRPGRLRAPRGGRSRLE